MELYLHSIFKKTLAYGTNFTETRYWQWKFALICILLVIFFSFPGLESINAEHPTWATVLKQIQNPFVQYNADQPESHISKRTFRLTIPLLFNLLHIHSIWVIYTFQLIVNLCFFYILIKLTHKITTQKVTAMVTALAFAFIYAGQVGVVDTHAKFDGIAVTCLLAALFFPNPLLIFLFVFFAGWTDERGIVAAGMIFLWWKIQETDKKNLNFKHLLIPGVRSTSVILACISYFAVRQYLSDIYGLTAVKGTMGLSIFTNQFNMLLFGLWSAFEGLWIIIFAAFGVLLYKRQPFKLMLLIATASVSVLVSFFVLDITRSIIYTLPLFFISLQIISQSCSPTFLRKMLLLCFFICLLVPTYFAEGAFRIEGNNPFIFKILKKIV